MSNEGLVTRNGIKAGDKVLFRGASVAYPRQNGFANSLLAKGIPYTVEFVFPGEDFEQIELEEVPDQLFIHDFFVRLPGK